MKILLAIAALGLSVSGLAAADEITPNFNPDTVQAVVFDGNVHGRDWTPAPEPKGAESLVDADLSSLNGRA